MNLNKHLAGKDYLVGNCLTVADVLMAGAFAIPFGTFIDSGF
jgi:elongation factor 1-gamma